MKKFWEKHDLLKVAGMMVVLTVILTWIIPQGYFQSEMVISEITRVGIFDFFTYGLLGMYYFTVLVTFILVLGGFYQVLARAGGYQKLTDAIAKKFKRKEIFFVLLVSFLIAVLTAVANEYFVVIVFAPFIITILSKMKLDKITGFVTTFGSILIGILGTVYTTKIIGQSVTQFGVEYGSYLWVKLVLFASAYIIFSVFNVLHIKKTLKAKATQEIEDMFISAEVTKKNKVWPICLILSLFAIVTILAYLPWSEVFNLTIWTKLTEGVMQFDILGAPVFAYIFGSVTEFGTWDIFGVQILMLITAVVVKVAYKITIEEFFTSFGEGLKKSGKLVVLLLVTYLILEFAVMYPVIPVIADWMMSITDKFNVLLGTITSLFVSLFSVEYQYTINLFGSYMATNYTSFANQISIMMQSTYGLASIFAPSSAILLIGLSACGITYKEWLKYIWKFLLIMLVVIVTLLLIIC